jgi:predicted small lipoprotein YifL
MSPSVHAMRLLTLLLLAALAASACGNKGPLYLPQDKPPVADDEDQTTPGTRK